MRLTKIICTLGPASSASEQIRVLAKAGMDIARINLSHGSKKDHRDLIGRIRALNDEGFAIGIMMDTKGSEIRTGDVPEPIEIESGQEVLFVTAPRPYDSLPTIMVDYPYFAEDVTKASAILLDNGEMSFDLVEARPDGTVVARAREAGRIGSRRHVNLPGVDLRLPSITEKDWEDLALGIEERVDFVALSFVRAAADVKEVKAFLSENGSKMRVVSKIETRRAVEHLDDIIDVSDVVMVARGDLGAEIPFEQVPAIQDEIVRKCRARGRPVIVATHMLESMIQHPIPTRAEATDVAHAAITQTDATMLSGETAAGRHPLLALGAMDRILRETEKHYPAALPSRPSLSANEYDARAEAATIMATAMRCPAIIVLTRTSRGAMALSKCRPAIPIIAFANTPEVQRALQMCYGVTPMLLPFENDPEETIERALEAARDVGLVHTGERIVLVADTRARQGTISAVHIRPIP